MTREERLKKDGFEGVEPVLFYRSTTKGSNFSPHAVRLIDPWTGKPRVYKTGEHRYQAMKSIDQAGHDYVCAAPTPMESKNRGRSVLLRTDWGDTYGTFAWYVMFEVVMAKTLQHKDVSSWLSRTGDRPIYEDSPTDDIWGWRFQDNHSGKNLLGRCWMQVRGVGRGLKL